MLIAAPGNVLISRCAWHDRNYGHAKLLGVSTWRGRGIAFTNGLCSRCAARINPAVPPQVIRGVTKRGCPATVAGLSAVMMALMQGGGLAPHVPSRELRSHHAASLPREFRSPPGELASPPKRAPLRTPGTPPRPVRMAQAHSRPPASATRISLPCTVSFTESSAGRRSHQSP